MNIKLIYAPTMTLEEFADKHSLVLIVEESNGCDAPRYAAHFEKAQVNCGGETVVWVGTGNTQYEAVVNYANFISGRTLFVSFAKQNCDKDTSSLGFVTIHVPRLTVTPSTVGIRPPKNAKSAVEPPDVDTMKELLREARQYVTRFITTGGGSIPIRQGAIRWLDVVEKYTR